jgi:multidrug efflux system outer membrane protein
MGNSRRHYLHLADNGGVCYAWCVARWLILPVLLFLSGCTLHTVVEDVQPEVEVPEAYSDALLTAQETSHEIDRWWTEFDEPSLNELMDLALQSNLDIKQAWSRLTQARQVAGIAGAEHFPQIGFNANVTDTNFQDEKLFFSTISPSDTRWLWQLQLSYEIDLWRRIDSEVRSALWSYQATGDDLQATALLLTRQVVDLWLTIQEQQELLIVLDKQIAANRTLLELIELRFTYSQSSALDVYQQRQTLVSREAQVPPIQSTLEKAQNQLQVLLGMAPKGESFVSRPLPKLPPMPNLDNPAALLNSRPDVRAAHARVVAADYQVAVAIARQLPSLGIDLAYQGSTTDLSTLLQRQIRQAVGRIAGPIVDGGALASGVELQKAVVEEAVSAFTEVFLNALLEVENAVVEERLQRELLVRLEAQYDAASSSLREAQSRYIYGLVDYLSVIAAIQAKQTVELSLTQQKKQLLSIRVSLYAALGGTWTQELVR